MWQVLNELKIFHRTHAAVAVFVWLAATIGGLIYGASNGGVGLAISAGVAITFMLMRYEKALETRMAASDGGIEWQVMINGIEVGVISDARYATIRRNVFFNVETYFCQTMNLGRVVARAVDMLFVAIPLSVFWVGVACYFLAPETFADISVAVLKASREDIGAMMPALANLALGSTFIAAILMVAINGRVPSFVNQFRRDCDIQVRRAVNCAAEGEVRLFCWQDGKYLVPNEAAGLVRRN